MVAAEVRIRPIRGAKERLMIVLSFGWPSPRRTNNHDCIFVAAATATAVVVVLCVGQSNCFVAK